MIEKIIAYGVANHSDSCGQIVREEIIAVSPYHCLKMQLFSAVVIGVESAETIIKSMERDFSILRWIWHILEKQKNTTQTKNVCFPIVFFFSSHPHFPPK